MMNTDRSARAVLETLKRDLRDPRVTERQNALIRLAEWKPPDCFSLLAAMLNDLESSVRVEAIVGIGELDDPAVVALLIDRARNSSTSREREVAIGALRRFSGEAVKSCLLAAVISLNSNNHIRLRAARHLWKFPDQEVVDTLQKTVLDDPDSNVRSHAAVSLFFIFKALEAPPDWKSFWIDASKDEIGVSRFAAEALELIEAKDA